MVFDLATTVVAGLDPAILVRAKWQLRSHWARHASREKVVQVIGPELHMIRLRDDGSPGQARWWRVGSLVDSRISRQRLGPAWPRLHNVADDVRVEQVSASDFDLAPLFMGTVQVEIGPTSGERSRR